MGPLFRGSKIIHLSLSHFFHWKPELLRCIFRLGIPASTETLFFQIGKLIVQTFIVRLGTAVIAATAIASSIASLLMIPGNALAIAAMTLVGQQIGKGQPLEAKKQLKFLILSSSAAIGLLSLTMLPCLNGLIGLYTTNPADGQMARQMLLSYLIFQPLVWSTSFITPAGLRGAGDVRYTMAISMISMGVLRIFLAYAFTMWLPLGGLGIWLAMYCDWIGRSICFIARLKGNRWYTHKLMLDKAG
jgi:Na+-driven multidrug efflux pump